MTKKERYKGVVGWFEENMPVAETELHYDSPFHLLVAVILSTQCTDKRVNMTTPELFNKFPDPKTLAEASFDEVFPLISSISYPRNKSSHLIGMAQMLVNDFGGEVPSDIDQLMKLPGVGRKTANLIMGDVFHAPSSVVTDTHLIRISNRIGLVDTKDPKKVEFELRKLLPPDESNDFCHRTVLHGRAVCTARKAHCDICTLKDFCKKKI